MGKLTAEARAELERQLAEDDEDGDDFEFHLTEGDRSVSLPWSRRESLAELGFKPPVKAPPARPPGKAGQDPKTGAAGAPATSLFGPRNRKAGS